jgi:hypothetical protein
VLRVFEAGHSELVPDRDHEVTSARGEGRVPGFFKTRLPEEVPIAAAREKKAGSVEPASKSRREN